ncbi:MAG: four helix bundle protein [Deltaproteobacteria bacterium]
MKTFRFVDFQVYKDAKEFYKLIIKETSKFPKEFLFDLTSQLRRSALSVALNIAEGSAKKSDKDFNRFIEISLGSINESVACLEISFEIGLISKAVFNDLLLKAENITRQLGGFSKKLKS